jgi:hypothetical protein
MQITFIISSRSKLTSSLALNEETALIILFPSWLFTNFSVSLVDSSPGIAWASKWQAFQVGLDEIARRSTKSKTLRGTDIRTKTSPSCSSFLLPLSIPPWHILAFLSVDFAFLSIVVVSKCWEPRINVIVPLLLYLS